MFFFNPAHLVSFHVCQAHLHPSSTELTVALHSRLSRFCRGFLTTFSYLLAHTHTADRLILCCNLSLPPPILELPSRFLSGHGTLSPLLQPVTSIPQPLFPPAAPSRPQGHGSYRLCPPGQLRSPMGLSHLNLVQTLRVPVIPPR